MFNKSFPFIILCTVWRVTYIPRGFVMVYKMKMVLLPTQLLSCVVHCIVLKCVTECEGHSFRRGSSLRSSGVFYCLLRILFGCCLEDY